MKTLAELELQSAQLTADIARLKEAEKHVPWEPTHWGSTSPYVGLDGIAHNSAAYKSWAKTGRVFQTIEAAEKASKFFTFYQRLYQLALECNAKHRSPNSMHRFCVACDAGPWTTGNGLGGRGFIDQLFTSKAAAQEACDIMNRDKWIIPTV